MHHRGRINLRSITIISSLTIIAFAGAYSWDRRRRSHQQLFEPPSKNTNPGKMAVLTPFHVSELSSSVSSLGLLLLSACLIEPPLLFHTPFVLVLHFLAWTNKRLRNSG